MQDLHVHTTYCDGRDTPEEMVLAAIEKGMDTLGFSVHGYTSFDSGCCIPMEKIPVYCAEIATLKEKYKDKIRILCGVEQDVYGDLPTDGFDYVIASAHYVKIGGEIYTVDNGIEEFRRAADAAGGVYALADLYYDTLAKIADGSKPTLIGHFDLVTKYNEKYRLFDENDPRYIRAWKRAADRLVPLHVPFEINTGAIARGHRTTPYPSLPIIEYLREKGASFCLSGDVHKKENLAFQFDIWKKLL